MSIFHPYRWFFIWFILFQLFCQLKPFWPFSCLLISVWLLIIGIDVFIVSQTLKSKESCISIISTIITKTTTTVWSIRLGLDVFFLQRLPQLANHSLGYIAECHQNRSGDWWLVFGGGCSVYFFIIIIIIIIIFCFYLYSRFNAFLMVDNVLKTHALLIIPGVFVSTCWTISNQLHPTTTIAPPLFGQCIVMTMNNHHH